jgi:hypothetical protein
MPFPRETPWSGRTDTNTVQTSGFWGIGAIAVAIRVPRETHVRLNGTGLDLPRRAKRTSSEDLGVALGSGSRQGQFEVRPFGQTED